MHCSEEACNAFSCIAMREAILTNCSKSQVLGDLYGRLSIVLVKANARAILATSLQVADMQWTTDLSMCICLRISFMYVYCEFNSIIIIIILRFHSIQFCSLLEKLVVGLVEPFAKGLVQPYALRARLIGYAAISEAFCIYL